jgi:hypothetical protein
MFLVMLKYASDACHPGSIRKVKKKPLFRNIAPFFKSLKSFNETSTIVKK